MGRLILSLALLLTAILPAQAGIGYIIETEDSIIIEYTGEGKSAQGTAPAAPSPKPGAVPQAKGPEPTTASASPPGARAPLPDVKARPEQPDGFPKSGLTPARERRARRAPRQSSGGNKEE